MKIEELYEIFKDFRDNEFRHFRDKIERRTFWILTFLIATLTGIIIDLLITKIL